MRFSSLVRPAAVALFAGLALTACSDKLVPPCPSIRVDNNTARFVKFQQSQRDLTEVAYAVDLIGYQGQCVFTKQGVDVQMDVTFDVTAGPGATPETVRIPYFVAIPQFYPQADGKQVMDFSVKLPSRAGLRARVQENGIHVFIPLKKDEPAAAYDVYVGLQMSDADADYNRARDQHLRDEQIPKAP